MESDLMITCAERIPDLSTNEVINQMHEIIVEEETKLIKELSYPKITDMIDRLLQIIPEKESKLIKELDKYSKDKWNIAPEALSDVSYYRGVRNILNNNITNIDCDWKKELVKVFNNPN